MRLIILFQVAVVFSLVVAISACGADNNEEDGGRENVGTANPASVNCLEKGGELEIATDASGAQYGVCKLTDGTVCEEWDYFRGDCPKVDSGLNVMCTQEAKICSDGTAVGRTGPHCEFAACPNGD